MLRAIPTTYKGVLFASRLEADWAKNLDLLRMTWQYEPEGVVLPTGAGYLSDIYLPRLRTWVEVKGPHDQRIDKPGALASAVQHAAGCHDGTPVRVFDRTARDLPAGRGCACGFGPDFPYMLVVVGRPATNGRLTFEPVHGPTGVDARLAVMRCRSCDSHSFTDLTGLPTCRRCWCDATGSPCYPSRALPFTRAAVPRGRGLAKKVSSTTRS